MNTKEEAEKQQIRYLLGKRYTALESATATLEKELVTLTLGNNSKSIEKGRVLASKYTQYLTDLVALEDDTQPHILSFPPVTSKTYRLLLLNGYCLFFYATKALSYLFEINLFPQQWGTINNGLNRTYPLLPTEFHISKKHELFFGQASILLLQEIYRKKLFHTDHLEVIRLINTHEVFRNFTARINPEQSLLIIQCYIYLFIFENDDSANNCAEVIRREVKGDDYYYQQIFPLIGKISEGDNRLYFYFAHATTLFNKLNQIISRNAVEGHDSRKKTGIKTTSKIRIRNPQAFYSELRRILTETKLKEALSYLKNLTKEYNPNFVFGKTLQTREAIVLLLDLLLRCLSTATTSSNYLVTRTSDKSCWQLYYDALVFKKECLDSVLAVHALKHQMIGAAATAPDVAISDQLNTTIGEIKKLDEERIRADQNLKSLLAPVASKISRKVSKEAQVRKAFSDAKMQLNSPAASGDETTKIDSNPFDDDMLQASQLLATNVEDALKIYQDLLGNEAKLNSLQMTNLHLALGDVYKKSSQEKALHHYHLAENIAKKSLTKENDSSIRNEIEIYHDIAKSLILELSKTNHEPAAARVTSDQQTVTPTLIIPTYQQLQTKLELPLFFIQLQKLLEQNGYYIFITGGYLRDHLLQEKAYDIDLVIFDPTFTIDLNTLLANALSLLKMHYPNCTMRSKKYPILYLEHKNTIVEISTLKMEPSIIGNSLPFEQKLLQLLYCDALHRDTTDNALYYDVKEQVLIDFFHGMEDIKENRLQSIQTPELSFEEDATRIFRVLRAITRRSMKQPDLEYSPKIIAAMQAYGQQIAQLNKDKCFAEINKILFRGNAFPTWQFLLKHNLQHYLFLLPTNEESHFRHSVMVANALSNLDNRIQKKINYNTAFVFAVILWGAFNEELEKKNESLTEKLVDTLARKTLTDPKLIFRIPDILIEEIKTIWLVHLHSNNLLKIEKFRFNYHEFRMGRVFSHLISQAITLSPKEKIKLPESKSRFFNTKLESLLREIIHENGITFHYDNKVFYLSLAESKKIITPFDRNNILRDIKRNIQIIAGRADIEYHIEQDTLAFTTDLFHKKRALDRLMNLLFETKCEHAFVAEV